METIKEIILINFFWFSLPLIGYSLMRLIAAYKKTPQSIRSIIEALLHQHVFIVMFSSFVAICCIMAPLALLSYLIQAPIYIYVALYLVLLTISVVYIVSLFLKFLFKVSKIDPLKLAGQTNLAKYATVTLLLFLLFDFIVSLYLKSYVISGVDSYYHLTRIVSMLGEGHFTVESGFYTGVMDSSYHANFIYSLYLIPVKLLGYSPMEVWGYSFGFFRLIQWMAIFTFSYTLIRRWLNVNKALFITTIATMVAIAIFSFFYYIAVYPNQVVMAWVMGFIAILLIYVERPKRVLLVALLLVAGLITTTHPTYSLMTAAFLCYWYILHLILHERSGSLVYVRQTWQLVFLPIVLMVGPLISRLAPSHVTAEQKTVTASQTIEVLNMTMISPHRLIPTSNFQLVILVLSLLGLVYLFSKWKWRTKSSSILIGLVSFGFIVLYLPPVFTVLATVLPVWLIERFESMNLLKFILPTLGILALGVWIINSKWVKPIFNKKEERASSILLVLATLALIIIAVPIHYASLASTKKDNQYAYEYSASLQQGLEQVLPQGSRVLADDRISYQLPAIVPINVISVEAGHSTMSADTENRIKCKTELFNSLRHQDMEYVKLDYILLSKFDKDATRIQELINKKPYIRAVAKAADLTVYKVDRNNIGSFATRAPGEVYPACMRYTEVEKG